MDGQIEVPRQAPIPSPSDIRIRETRRTNLVYILAHLMPLIFLAFANQMRTCLFVSSRITRKG